MDRVILYFLHMGTFGVNCEETFPSRSAAEGFAAKQGLPVFQIESKANVDAAYDRWWRSVGQFERRTGIYV